MEYTITRNEAFNSLEISFDGKPAEAVRDALKALRFRWHSKRRVWYGYTDEETARAAIDNAGTEAAPVAKVPAPVIDKTELRRQFEKAWDSPRMVDYCVKKVAAVATLPSGEIITIDRQSIETRFCFGESGYDYDEAAETAQYARTSEDYFKRENMKYFEDLLHDIDESADIMGHAPRLVIYTGGAYIGQAADCALRNYGFAKLCDVIEACGGSCHLEDLPGRELVIRGQASRIATAEELSIIRAAVQSAAAAHEKRVETYLKRYGTSKVHSWTYWRDA